MTALLSVSNRVKPLCHVCPRHAPPELASASEHSLVLLTLTLISFSSRLTRTDAPNTRHVLASFSFVLDPLLGDAPNNTSERADVVGASSDGEQVARDAIRGLITTEEWSAWGEEIQQMMPGRVDRRTFEVYKKHRDMANRAAGQEAELEMVRAAAERDRAELGRQQALQRESAYLHTDILQDVACQ